MDANSSLCPRQRAHLIIIAVLSLVTVSACSQHRRSSSPSIALNAIGRFGPRTSTTVANLLSGDPADLGLTLVVRRTSGVLVQMRASFYDADLQVSEFCMVIVGR